MNKWFHLVVLLNGLWILIMIAMLSTRGETNLYVKAKNAILHMASPLLDSSRVQINGRIIIEQAEKTNSDGAKRFFKQNGKDLYSFFLYGVMPNVDCSKFTAENYDLSHRYDRNILIGEVGVRVKTTILHNFSPEIDEDIRSKFPKEIVDQNWFENHPFQISCHPKENQNLFCLFRIWLNLIRYKTEPEIITNRYQDSYFYGLELDKNLTTVKGSANIIGIPTTVQDTAFNGPEDPRVIKVNGTTFANFVTSMRKPYLAHEERHQKLWDLDENVYYESEVENFDLQSNEKNWTPWVLHDVLHFVYQFTPVFRALRCEIQKPPVRKLKCSFFVGQPPHRTLNFSTNDMLLRGGTPIVAYTVPDYYLAITHSVQDHYDSRRNLF